MDTNIKNFEVNDFETENITENVSPERNSKQIDFRPNLSEQLIFDRGSADDTTPNSNNILLLSDQKGIDIANKT